MISLGVNWTNFYLFIFGEGGKANLANFQDRKIVGGKKKKKTAEAK